MLSQKTFFQLTAAIFLILSLMHVLRLFFDLEASIAGWNVPLGVSIVAAILGGYLGYNALKFAGK